MKLVIIRVSSEVKILNLMKKTLQKLLRFLFRKSAMARSPTRTFIKREVIQTHEHW